jgi:C-terminal processing protease CtpA/Prc
VLALLLLAAPIAAQQTRTPRPAPAPRAPCDTCDDSAADLSGLGQRLEEARRAVEAAQDAMQQAQEALRESSDSGSDARTAYEKALRELRTANVRYQVIATETMRKAMAKADREMRRAMQRERTYFRQPSPKGWLGVTFSGSFSVTSDSGRKVQRFDDYPVIEAVEPDSPADKAGIESRDRLMAIDGHDVCEGTPPFSTLLTPGNRLKLRVKRGRYTKDLQVTVERRPSDWGMVAPVAPVPPIAAVPAPEAAPEAAPTPMPPMPPMSPIPPGVSVRVFGPDAMSSSFGDQGVIAGAQVQTFSALKEYFGVDNGVLVLRVLSGTPADRAGLRDGDVIVRVDGREVTTPGGLARQLERARDREAKLEIVRKKQRKEIRLRWER